MREEMATERFAFFSCSNDRRPWILLLGTKRKTKWVISFPLFNGSDAVVRRQILIHSSGGGGQAITAQGISSFSFSLV